MTRRRRLARPGAAGAAAGAALLLLTACSGSDTPADDISPEDTLQSSTVGTDPDATDGPTGSPDE